MENKLQEQIDKLLEEGNVDKALEIQEQVDFKQQIEHIDDLLNQDRYEEALILCDIFDNNIEIQYTKIKILLKLKRMDEILEISEQSANNIRYQSQIIRILIEHGKYEYALEICNKYPACEIIQSQKITILINQKEFVEALKTCDKFPNYEPIQSQKVKILIDGGKFGQALIICNKFPNSEILQSQKVIILIRKGKLTEALKICDKHLDNKYFEGQKVAIYIYMNRYEEALAICEHPTNINNPHFIKKAEKIRKKLGLNTEKTIENNDIKNTYLDTNTILLTRVYCGDISIDELEKQNIDEWSKIVLLAAYYEKNNKKMGIKKLKGYKQNLESYYVKQINLILERLISNKITVFDITFYGRFIKCHIDEDLVQEIFSKQEEQRKKELEEQQKNVSNVVKPINKPVKKVNQLPTVRTVQQSKNSSQVSKTKPVVETKKEDVIKKEKKVILQKSKETYKNVPQLLIKDLFKEEVLEVQLYLYVQMNRSKRQMDAVKAWDNFEEMIIKPVSDKEALNKMVNFLKRIEPSTDVSITVDEKKYTKYLNI